MFPGVWALKTDILPGSSQLKNNHFRLHFWGFWHHNHISLAFLWTSHPRAPKPDLACLAKFGLNWEGNSRDGISGDHCHVHSKCKRLFCVVLPDLILAYPTLQAQLAGGQGCSAFVCGSFALWRCSCVQCHAEPHFSLLVFINCSGSTSSNSMDGFGQAPEKLVHITSCT